MNPRIRVCLFSLPSRYEVGGHFIEELGKAFAALGASVTTLNPLDDDLPKRFASLAKRPPTFCLALNALTADMEIEGRAYHEHLNCPLVGLYIDDPLVPALSQRLCRQNHIATQVSPALSQLVEKRFSLPAPTIYHGASAPSTPPSDERPIDLLLAGTYISPEGLRREWQEELPKAWQREIEKLIERAKTDDERPIWEIWDSGASFANLVGEHMVVPRAEQYIRHWRRDQLLQTLEGVTLIGDGWENSPHTAAHKVLGPASYRESIALMGEAKVVLHITPPFCAGSHERPLTAMLQGCAAVVDGSPFFQNTFKTGLELVSYSWKDLSTLPAAVDCALKNWELLGKGGQKAVDSAHTWQHRAAQILELIDVDCNF